MRSRVLIGVWAWRLLAMLALVAALAIVPARAATEVLYVGATGHYMRGVFRDFWDKNGGLANFGHPITEEYVDQRTNRVYQYFERARFERASPSATQVDLGLLGREVAGSRSFATSAAIANSAQRRYFPETKHIVQFGFRPGVVRDAVVDRSALAHEANLIDIEQRYGDVLTLEQALDYLRTLHPR